MPPPPDPSSIWVDAAISGGLGLLAGLVRWLTSADPKCLGYHLRHLLVAGITGGFAGLAIADLVDSEGLRYALSGITGYAGIALWDVASENLRKFLERIK